MNSKEDLLNQTNYFEIFFHHLASFSWEKAKEFAEKKQLIPSPLQVALVTLAQNEKMYYSMEFLEQRWFGRRDPLKNAYANLQSNFLNIGQHESRIGSQGDNTEDFASLIPAVCLQLADFCSARIDFISLYMQIPKSSLLNDVDSLIEGIHNLESYATKLSCSVLNELQETYIDELTALLSLLQSIQNLSKWDFVESVHSMQEVFIVLDKWKSIFGKQPSSSFRSGFFGFVEKTSNPSSALYTWMDKFFKTLVSKFTFYFYENLNRSASNSEDLKSELRNGLSKLSYDFVSKTTNLIRKTDANCVSLILDTQGTTNVPTYGYILPANKSLSNEDEQTEDFFTILSFPESSSLDMGLVKSMLSDKAEDLRQDKMVSVQNAEKKMTCFCAQLEQRIYLCVSFGYLKSERDAHVANYFNDLVQHMKLKKVIKPHHL